MTVMAALTAIKNIKPNQYDDATLTRWLAELDARIYEDVILSHETGEAFKPPHSPDVLLADQSTTLLVPFPHDDVYVKWMGAQIDYNNAEFDRYNNGMAMYNAGLQAFVDSFNRAYMPKQDFYVEM